METPKNLKETHMNVWKPWQNFLIRNPTQNPKLNPKWNLKESLNQTLYETLKKP